MVFLEAFAWCTKKFKYKQGSVKQQERRCRRVGLMSQTFKEGRKAQVLILRVVTMATIKRFALINTKSAVFCKQWGFRFYPYYQSNPRTVKLRLSKRQGRTG